jgi:hypothetical protein
LRRANSILSKLIEEYGSQEHSDEGEVKHENLSMKAKDDSLAATDPAGQPKPNATLMQAEERETGGFSLSTYLEYLQYAGR